MNKLLIALTAGAFALGSVAALADDKTPAAPVDQAKLKAERDAAKAAAAKMTPEEKAAAKKAKRAERQQLPRESDKPLMGDFWSPGDPLYPPRKKLDEKAKKSSGTPSNTPLIGDFNRPAPKPTPPTTPQSKQ